MEIRRIFINKWGRLRSGWRVAIFVVVYIAFQLAFDLVYRGLHSFLAVTGTVGWRNEYIENLIFRFNILAASMIAGYVCVRVIEGLPWKALGLTFHRKWFQQFFAGSVVGAGSLAIAAVIAVACGGLRLSLSSERDLALIAKEMFGTAVLFIVAALAEEALFRGYPLQTLTRAQLAWLGVLLTSIPFAAVHLANPNVVAGFTFINTALAGVWLGTAYLRTRSLWFPLGVHWAWNWTMNSVIGVPVSGLRISSHPLLTSLELGPAWLTGGNYGIEGGAACIIALLISMFFIWRTRWVTATTEMLALTSHENPAPSSAVQSILPEHEPL
jgi:membrane protease YdiL (CAAX protease family)